MATSKYEKLEEQVEFSRLVQSTGALLRAAYEGRTALVAKMLSHGMPVSCQNAVGLQAVHFAAKRGSVETMAILIKHGADVNAVSHRGSTPLQVAALLGHTEVVKLLLKSGADVNLRSNCNEDQFSALYMAAQIGQQEIVTLLLVHGADPSFTTKNGSTPKDVAHQQGFTAVAQLLEEYERRIRDCFKDSAEAVAPPSEAPAGDAGAAGLQAAGGAAVGEKPLTGSGSNGAQKMGQPPVYQEVIPSPHHSPLRTRSKKMQALAKDSSLDS